MTEQDILEEEGQSIDEGAEARDLSTYTSWREDTDPEVLEAIEFYGTYMMGQTNGLSDALSLPALVAAFDLLSVEPEERPDLAQRILAVHATYMAEMRAKEKMASHGR